MKAGKTWRGACYAGLMAAVVCGILTVTHAGTINLAFEQVNWLDSTGGDLSRDSDWGTVLITLNDADSEFYDMTTYSGQTGRGGYFNLVTNAGGSAEWEVVNLPVFYTSTAELAGRLPQEVCFELYDPGDPGTPLGTDVTTLSYLYTVDHYPRDPATGQPTGAWSGTATVSEFDYRVSGDGLWVGTLAPEGGGINGPMAAMDFEGAGAGETVGYSAGISVTENSIATVNEGGDECAPGSVARSLKYMGDNHDNVNVPDSAQTVHGELAGNMKTNSGKKGTYTTDILAGKNKYVSDHNLPIMSAQTGSFAAAQDTLAKDGDVEMGVYWGEENGQSQGGHRTFVSEIQELVDGDGNTTGWVVRGIDDPDQTDNTAENRTHTYKFDANGNLVQYDGGPAHTNAALINFQVEQVRMDRSDMEFPWGSGFAHAMAPYSEPPYGPPTPYPIPVGLPGSPTLAGGLTVRFLGPETTGNGDPMGPVVIFNPDAVDSFPGSGQTVVPFEYNLEYLDVTDPSVPTPVTATLEFHHLLPESDTEYGWFIPAVDRDSTVMLENLFVTGSFFDISYFVGVPGEKPQFYQLHGEIDEELLGQVWFLGMEFNEGDVDPEAWVESFFDVSFQMEIDPSVWGPDGAWAAGFPLAGATLFSMQLTALQTAAIPEPATCVLMTVFVVLLARRRTQRV
ncbi:MAG: hypothetical protein K9N51_01730 [Candidatus Pacebacteria bacterium]|nr:hypothetical protein [Candidatus Paceibacterota bacterium]